MAKFRIGVLDPIAEEGLQLLRADSEFEYVEKHGLKGEDLKFSWLRWMGRSFAAA